MILEAAGRNPTPLGVKDVLELLSKSENARQSILVGGQAANFWAEHYGVVSKGVMLSKDIDFLGSASAAMEAGLEWGARVELPSIDNFTPNTAIVYLDIDKEERGIDFLESILGVDNDELNRMAVNIEFPAIPDSVMRVMHPLHCMISQIYNAYDKHLNRRADPDNGDWIAERAKISVETLNRNIREYLDMGDVNAAKKIVQKIAIFAAKTPTKEAFIQDHIDVLHAIPIDHPGWKEKFSKTMVEPLKKRIERKRIAYSNRKCATKRL